MNDVYKQVAGEYLALISDFVQNQLTADAFATVFDRKFLGEPGGRLDRPLFMILENLWEDVEAYDSMWNTEDESLSRITEATLRREAETALTHLNRYLAVGILSEHELLAHYQPLGLPRGGEHYLTQTQMLSLVADCQLNDLCVLGIEGFDVSEKQTRPRMDLIVDFSYNHSLPWAVCAQRCNTAAADFLNSVPPEDGLLYCVVLLSREEHERAGRRSSPTG